MYKCATIKLLGENIGENLHDLGLGKECIDITPKAWSINGEKK